MDGFRLERNSHKLLDQKYPSVFDHEWINCRLTEKEINNFTVL